MMDLNTFITDLKPGISHSAYDYVTSVQIDGPVETSKGTWEAMVGRKYMCKVSIDGTNITSWECACTDSGNHVCKHVAATLMLIAKKMATDKASAKQDQITQILQNVSVHDLRDFIEACIRLDDGWRNRFLAHFADRLPKNPSSTYRDVVRSYLRNAQTRYGYIDYRSITSLVQSLDGLNDSAESLLAGGKIEESLELCKTLVEEVSENLQWIHDEGEVSMVVDDAFAIFGKIAKTGSGRVKEELFNWCMDEHIKQKYEDYGLEGYFLDLLPELVCNPELERRFFDWIELQIGLQKKESFPEYGLTKLIQARINYLMLVGRNEEALEQIRQNVHIDSFREQLVELAIQEGDFEQAKSLCLQAIQENKKQGYAGFAGPWREQLFQIAKQENDYPEMRRLAENLFYINHHDIKWYRQLKSLWEKGSWSKKCEEILARIEKERKSGRYGGHRTVLAAIYIEEGYDELLLKLVRNQAGDIGFFRNYGLRLAAAYPKEILDLYERGIKEYAKRTGRKYYRKLGEYLEELRQLKGGEERARALVTRLLQEFTNRPAMKEELAAHFPDWD